MGATPKQEKRDGLARKILLKWMMTGVPQDLWNLNLFEGGDHW